MNRRVAAVVFSAAFLSSMSPAQAAPDAKDCVSGGEWQNLAEDHGTTKQSDRRRVIEKAWDVKPIGRRNAYFQMDNPRLYTVAYPSCGDDDVVVVVAYRKTSQAWVVAIKGALVPEER